MLGRKDDDQARTLARDRVWGRGGGRVRGHGRGAQRRPTLLIERDACLGGTMTTCLVGPMMTFHSPQRQVIGGLAQEVVDRLQALGASPGHILDTSDYCYTITPFDAEALKLVCQRMVLEAGAENPLSRPGHGRSQERLRADRHPGDPQGRHGDAHRGCGDRRHGRRGRGLAGRGAVRIWSPQRWPGAAGLADVQAEPRR